LSLDFVSNNLRSDDLSDDFLVGESNDQSVLGSIVLIFVLIDESSSGIVIGLALSSSSVFGLVSLEVSVVLD